MDLVVELVAGAAAALPSGSPPWIMKSGMTRWKMVPSYSLPVVACPVPGSVHCLPPSASSTKLRTVFGA